MQYYYCTMDPLDSNLIINEQSMNLTAHFRLPIIQSVILKSEFRDHIIKLRGEQVTKLQQIELDEEIDRKLSKSQSVSFTDLIEIKHVRRLTFASVCLTINYLIFRGV